MIGQACQRLDGLRLPKPNRAAELGVTRRADVSSCRRHAFDSALGDIGRHRDRTKQARFTVAISQRIKQVFDIGSRRLGKSRADLTESQGFGVDCRQYHLVDAEARFDGFDLVAQQFGQAPFVAQRLCGGNRYGLDPVVDADEA